MKSLVANTGLRGSRQVADGIRARTHEAYTGCNASPGIEPSEGSHLGVSWTDTPGAGARPEPARLILRPATGGHVADGPRPPAQGAHPGTTHCGREGPQFY